MRVLAGDQGVHVALHQVDENKITGVVSFDPILTLRMRRANVSSDTFLTWSKFLSLDLSPRDGMGCTKLPRVSREAERMNLYIPVQKTPCKPLLLQLFSAPSTQELFIIRNVTNITQQTANHDTNPTGGWWITRAFRRRISHPTPHVFSGRGKAVFVERFGGQEKKPRSTPRVLIDQS